MKKKLLYIMLGIFIALVVAFGITWHFKGNIIKTYLIKHDVIEMNLNDRTDRIPILTFHSIVPDEDKENYYSKNQWVGKESTFEEMMKYLHDNDYHTLTLDEFYKWYKGEIELKKNAVLITFDDGKTDNYYFAAPILKKYDIHATFFIIGNKIEETTKPYTPGRVDYVGEDAMDDIRENYPTIELQSHSYGFHYQKDKHYKVQDFSKEELLEDFEKQKELGFEYIAYPYGVYNDDVIAAAKEKDFKLGFAFKKYGYAYRGNNQYAIPRIKINGEVDLDYLKKWLKH